ncbi:MAG: tRNA (N6-isopentenyl adenosine(37)-C2)-methylthiotransferase MiaB, partial [Cyanobacteria bacterium]|nr:tRNA (N6-isopentenyl adenosine(37)-C2)-methylthiotransferase MiaB [Cyanobacteriota bacterium]
VFGTQNIQELPELVRKAFAGTDRIVAVDRQKPRSTFDYFSDVSPKRESDILAWVPIIEGCDYFCTYCVVPYTRGRQLSRPPESILREVIELGSSGFKEITLLGQTVDSYGKDFEKNPDGSYYDFATLLHEVHAIEGIERIRFMTSHPLDLNDAVIDAVATLPKVMEYIHIPMQSGDDEILAQMKRGYTREQYFDLVDKIYDRIPGVAVTGDYIVGFPGETNAQFENSLESIKRSRIHAANTARYSARKQTPAALMEQRGMEVPEAVKEERLQIMNALINEQSLGFNKEYLGKTVEVLVEGTSKRNEARLMGRTRNNKVVNFESPFTEDELVGQIISVEVSQVFGWSLMGNHCLASNAETLSETVSNPASWVPSR